MIKLRFKKPNSQTNVNIGKIFTKAVKGYKILKAKEERRIGVTRLSIETPETLRIPIEALISKKVEEEKPKIEGIIIPEKVSFVPRIKQEEIDLTQINLVYPLIPRVSTNPFAYADIKWSRAETSLIYYLVEPQLSPIEKGLLERIKSALIEKLDVDFTALKKGEARNYLKNKFEEMINLMAKDFPADKRQILLYFVERDFIGLGKIEPFMQDPDIEDISCDGIGIPLYVYHRNPVIGSVKTNIMFNSAEELDVFVNKLSQRCGKTISVAQPLIGGSLPDGSRIQATLGTDIARKGSNFTIRKFTEEPMTPTHLLRFKTWDSKIAAYLWLATEYGRSILISGGVATGKTTLLNALSLFIKPELRVVTIEDTPELRLPHPHWLPQVARQPIAEIEGKKLGEVDLFDLLRESLRQRPDYLIVGEVRGKEAYVLFQQIATGHASMSTMHADSMERLVDRLVTPPISLPANLIEALDIVIFIVKIKYGNTYVRRISDIYEILGFDREKNFPVLNEVFKWDPSTDTYIPVHPSVVLRKIAEQYGIGEEFLQKEMVNRTKILNWMLDRSILDYRDVARIVKVYYAKPEDILSEI
jgi:flagellar protein FlaI